MSTDKIESVQSSSHGALGRAVSRARSARLVLDSSTRPQPDVLTNSEAFLASISSCGVTLVEMHAADTGVPLRRMTVTIEGVRKAQEPARFAGITMRFELAGVDQAEAEALVETYRSR
jgi:uncharacterized OsmC-like protein